jgi:CTP synthase
MRKNEPARPKCRYIFVTGGVVSSLGKGVACAAIGALLEDHGLRVAVMKFDPYINMDAGTMNPFQHGEVFVTDDGAETDLDLGHYERYLEDHATRLHNVTTGQIYHAVIEKERRGEYLGKTVQVVPHITDEIKARVHKLAAAGAYDIVLVEVGGTVGDIESLPFLEAIRQMQAEMAPGMTLSMHLTLVPYIKAAGELKTKPTQHSVKEMREIGIQPDVLLCRTEKPFDEETRRKIALFCNVQPEAVIMAPDVQEVYTIPLSYKDQGLDHLLLKRLGIVPPDEVGDRLSGDSRGTMGPWRALAEQVSAAHDGPIVDIGFVGKYVNLQDAYKSVYEALRHAGFANGVQVEVHRIEAENVEDPRALEQQLRRMHGVLIPGGFGSRGIEGKVATAAMARREGIPYFGICLGMQVAVIEFAREICGLQGAHSTEMNPDTPHPVIDLMVEQKNVQAMGGTMRLGAYDCLLKSGTLAAEAYSRYEERSLKHAATTRPEQAQPKSEEIGPERLVVSERHRHRYEVNNKYLPLMTERGLVISGLNEASGLVEVVELPRTIHPWYLGCQFHPEFRSRPLAPHPLFVEFIAAAKRRSRLTTPERPASHPSMP